MNTCACTCKLYTLNVTCLSYFFITFISVIHSLYNEISLYMYMYVYVHVHVLQLPRVNYVATSYPKKSIFIDVQPSSAINKLSNNLHKVEGHQRGLTDLYMYMYKYKINTVMQYYTVMCARTQECTYPLSVFQVSHLAIKRIPWPARRKIIIHT